MRFIRYINRSGEIKSALCGKILENRSTGKQRKMCGEFSAAGQQRKMYGGSFSSWATEKDVWGKFQQLGNTK